MFGDSYEKAFNSLKNTVDQLAKKGQAREAKLEANLQDLTREAQSLKDSIGLKTQQLVDAEIEDDTKTQEQINKELAALRLQLGDFESKIAAYKSSLEFPGLSGDEVKKVKSAALKAFQERQKKAVDLDIKISKAFEQLQALNEEIGKMNEEKLTLDHPKEALIAKPVMKFVHPEFRDPKYETFQGEYQYRFVNWLNS
ncbi:MAG: hypothetical protein NC238_17970 [Dehalobacter sp.]|nr:hypothetical protein [Dehalobacter sp.]